jgi:3-oxoacyl-[acyl-carrier-protein] synthase II
LGCLSSADVAGRKDPMARRVVITSIGVISALGFSPEDIVANLKAGRIFFERTPFDGSVWACPIRSPFNIRDFTGRYKNARYLNRGAQFCVASAMAALRGSGLDGLMQAKAGLFVGTGPNLDIGSEFPQIEQGKLERADLAALWILRFLPNTAAAAISDLAGIHGENATLGTACSASLQAIGEAYRKVKHGVLDLALAGGGDSRLSAGALLAYRKAQALWTGDGNCGREYSPFDTRRQGFVPGEGGAFFVLEELEHARNRAGRIYAEVCGYGASLDGYNMTAPAPDGEWAEAAVRSALREAGLEAESLDVIFAHGTGTPLNDTMEANLISRVQGESRPPVVALKSWIGHLAAACGAVELAIGLACMERNYLPAIRNLSNPCREEVNFVRKAMEPQGNTMLLQNFGFGGQNSALVVKLWQG